MKRKLSILLIFLVLLSGCSNSSIDTINERISGYDNSNKMLQAEVDSLKKEISDLQQQIQALNEDIITMTEENASVNHRDVLCSEEALLLFSKGGTFSLSELGCDISTYKEGFLEMSWTNPGVGTGAVWYIDPYTGDVYDWDDSKMYNLFDKYEERNNPINK